MQRACPCFSTTTASDWVVVEVVGGEPARARRCFGWVSTQRPRLQSVTVSRERGPVSGAPALLPSLSPGSPSSPGSGSARHLLLAADQAGQGFLSNPRLRNFPVHSLCCPILLHHPPPPPASHQAGAEKQCSCPNTLIFAAGIYKIFPVNELQLMLKENRPALSCCACVSGQSPL